MDSLPSSIRLELNYEAANVDSASKLINFQNLTCQRPHEPKLHYLIDESEDFFLISPASKEHTLRSSKAKEQHDSVLFQPLTACQPVQPKPLITQPITSWSKRLLLVDDEPFNLMSLKFLLQKQFDMDSDFESHIDFANNGLEAVTMVKDKLVNGQQYGLILMDCSMPFLDGY